jgi:hypothetical protein
MPALLPQHLSSTAALTVDFSLAMPPYLAMGAPQKQFYSYHFNAYSLLQREVIFLYAIHEIQHVKKHNTVNQSTLQPLFDMVCTSLAVSLTILHSMPCISFLMQIYIN